MVLIDISETAMLEPVLIDVRDANGEASLTETVPADASGYDFTLIGYAQKLTGKPTLIDTSEAVVSVQ